MAENVDDRGDFLDEVDEISPKEQLEIDIAAAEAYVLLTKNKWAYRALQLLKAEYEANYFDEDGNEIEIPLPTGELAVQISPEEVLDAEGWWTAEVSGFTRPKYNRKLKKVNIGEGLRISKKRSNGGSLIFNAEMTADLWMNDPQKVSKALKFRASPRLLLLAGTMLKGRMFLLPTFHAPGADGLDDYSIKPEVPFNEAEQKIWYDNFKTYQKQGSLYMGGAIRWRFPVRHYPGPWSDMKNGKGATDVDPVNGKHIIPIWTNRTDWILPAVMADYNTITFKRDTYDQARRLAHQIDAGAARVPGYTHPMEWGADEGREGLEAWYKRFESTNGASRPRLQPGILEL